MTGLNPAGEKGASVKHTLQSYSPQRTGVFMYHCCQSLVKDYSQRLFLGTFAPRNRVKYGGAGSWKLNEAIRAGHQRHLLQWSFDSR